MAVIKSYSEDSLVTDLTGEIVESGKKFPYVALKKGDIISITGQCSDGITYAEELTSNSNNVATRLLKTYKKGKRSATVVYVGENYATIRLTDCRNGNCGCGWNVALNSGEFKGVYLLRRSA